ncbi:MAG: transcription antitermination factor NusB [Candidatus Margulisbacteria bacterium]|nr:transcription antitermination factor NusB [Candidatus Margulisiibacteriota bacterium]MBU1021134.1 transcription antitermination factor NusB [Candidatus Margulisiibacteriota bacterium]MBU1728689.1 transcription antitermination factor NusB [Candidatus Margulisiibacteriota bacterium]MBU1955140.1 transcription antitermination factor NusB [Candidatus Margulisiibacteriota bacterium]
MGKRSTARRLAMQALFQSDLSGYDIDKTLKDTFDTGEFIDDTKSFSTELAKGTWDHKDEIDKTISAQAVDWSLERMGVVDRNILRLGIFELKYQKGTPASVIINEAVELAKKFGSDDSAKFINGILGALAKK